jgi:quercetin dioxygenase-like cupin family protein
MNDRDELPSVEGWVFADSAALEWKTMAPGLRMKSLGMANGRMIALFEFDAGYVGGTHDHVDAEFTYLLEGQMTSNGVTMLPGHSYAAPAGTRHVQFDAVTNSTVLSVFAVGG